MTDFHQEEQVRGLTKRTALIEHETLPFTRAENGTSPIVTIPKPTVILLDIEGTICPISFVHDVLFPYALEALPRVAKTQWDNPAFQEYVKGFPLEIQSSPELLVGYVQDLTSRDVKMACLKNLQGYLWREGYENGVFSSPLFPDVSPMLKSWKNGGVHLAIYSSGSVAAQKLLLQFVQRPSDGDVNTTENLRSLFLGRYFDTVNAGPKMVEESYGKIAEEFDVPAFERYKIAFFSDNVNETQAAVEAGFTPIVVCRAGNAPLSEEDKNKWAGKTIEDFEQIRFEESVLGQTQNGSISP